MGGAHSPVPDAVHKNRSELMAPSPAAIFVRFVFSFDNKSLGGSLIETRAVCWKPIGLFGKERS